MSDNDSARFGRYRGPSLFWPVLLIGLGVLFLLYNLNLLPADPWPLLLRLWPVILILIGLDILLGRRSILSGVLGAIVALLVIGLILALVLTAQNNPAMLAFTTSELQTEHILQPLGNVRTASVSIDFPGGSGDLVPLEDSPNLVEADLRHYGRLEHHIVVKDTTASVSLSRTREGISALWGNNQEKWTIGLNSRVTLDLEIDTASGSYDVNLRPFTLKALRMDCGSGAVKLALPETGQYRFQLAAGSGDIQVHVPEGVAVRVEYDDGSGELNAPGLKRVSGDPDDRDGSYESLGFSQNGDYVIIALDGGSGSVTIR